MKRILITILLLLSISCSDKPLKWVANGTTIEATKYRLEISDSSKILIENDGNYTLFSPHDSLIISKFTINYSSVNSTANKYFKANADQQVKNALTPTVTEYYRFEKGNVLLLGYSTGDSIKPYTVFEPALIISPNKIDKEAVSSAVMKTFITEDKKFDDGYKSKLTIKELKQIKLSANKNRGDRREQSTACRLREMTLSRDAKISYGKNNLIIPEAVMFRTKLLLDGNGLPIAEWSIKSEKRKNVNETEEEIESREKNEPGRKIFIQVNLS